MAEIENYSRKLRNHKYLSVFSKNKTIPNKDSIMWIRSYSSVKFKNNPYRDIHAVVKYNYSTSILG